MPNTQTIARMTDAERATLRTIMTRIVRAGTATDAEVASAHAWLVAIDNAEAEQPDAGWPRSYVTGLPVVLEVHADGTVTYDVDLSEAADDLHEGAPTDAAGDPLYTDEQVDADIATIDAALAAGTLTPARS